MHRSSLPFFLIYIKIEHIQNTTKDIKHFHKTQKEVTKLQNLLWGRETCKKHTESPIKDQ